MQLHFHNFTAEGLQAFCCFLDGSLGLLEAMFHMKHLMDQEAC